MEFTKENTAALGNVNSGLFIICAQDKSHQDGYLASWVQQVSFKPLLVSIAIKPGRPAYDLIASGEVFSINIVGKDNNGVMKPFWSGYDPASNPFTNLSSKLGDQGGLLLNDCMAALECKKIQSIQPGDHEIVIAEVLQCYTIKENDVALDHIRKSGLDY